jgi:uncharacterized protein (DUF1778 family)
MARMTIRIPDSLHDSLASRAKAEGVSMNQFLVYALSQVAAIDAVNEQRRVFDALRTRLPPAEAEAALSALLEART